MAGPRSQEVIGRLLSEIREGRLAVGELLPPEVELALKLGVSRATVRTALDELEKLGVVNRRRGVGTRLLRSSVEGGTGKFSFELNRYEDLLRYASATRRITGAMESVVADRDLSSRLKTRPGSRWLRIDFTRVALNDDSPPPLIMGVLYAAEQYEPLLRDRLPDWQDSTVALIEENYGQVAASVMQSINAELPPAGTDGAAPADAVLRIMRYYMDANEAVFLVVENRYPASQFSYNITFNRERGA